MTNRGRVAYYLLDGKIMISLLKLFEKDLLTGLLPGQILSLCNWTYSHIIVAQSGPLSM